MGFGGGFGLNSEDMTALAALKRGILDDDLAKIGTEFKANDGTVRTSLGFARCSEMVAGYVDVGFLEECIVEGMQTRG
jgi:hypothetical protein